MLRRPFSIYSHSQTEFEIIVQVVGRGTSLIASVSIGDEVDVIGPLGNPWNTQSRDFETALLLIGGVGVASMPLLTSKLTYDGRQVETYYGARSTQFLVMTGLQNLHIATDDGSAGFHGTNIALLRTHLTEGRHTKPKLFVCGPTGMMRAAQQLAIDFGIPAEISLESEMACGIGICQGCPVLTDDTTFATTGKRFRLACTEGPSFDSLGIQI